MSALFQIIIEMLFYIKVINLIMQTKSQSCDRCTKQGQFYLSSNVVTSKITKKPQAYLAKKFQQLYEEDRKLRNKKNKKIDESARKKEQQQLQGCTFKPEIRNNPQYYVSNDPFLEREQNWKKHIDKKISEKREQQQKKQVNSFPFQPKISNSPLLSSQIKKTHNSTYSNKAGFVQKKSYKAIHTDQKKFKQLVKNTTIQPFKHRRINTLQSTSQIQHYVNSAPNINTQKNSMKKIQNEKDKFINTKTSIEQTVDQKPELNEDVHQIDQKFVKQQQNNEYKTPSKHIQNEDNHQANQIDEAAQSNQKVDNILNQLQHKFNEDETLDGLVQREEVPQQHQGQQHHEDDAF